MFELIIMLLISIMFFVIGYFLCMKQKISLIHSYHYTKVKQEDFKPYTMQIGKGNIIIGFGFLLTGIIDYFTNIGYGWLVVVLFLLLGLFVFIRAQLRYNGSIF